MKGDEIRQRFLRFFEERGHTVVPSSSLIPAGDPTLLLTSAGMVQFKPYFLGELTPPNHRLTSVQKCFRTTDIDEVGDLSHLTFFEMLGNFSIGDYFKEGAIEFAWRCLTEAFGLPKERLWVTVFREDDEAADLWKAWVPEDRIYRGDEEDNFWGPAGDSGPCGPCSEIHYDFGAHLSCGKPDCGPLCDCPRFVELWNLVFMQFNQAPDGSRTPLPAPNIDTGMGLERLTAILQGADNVYQTDLFWPIVERVVELSGVEYGKDPETDYAIRVVAEHGRSATFLISDGVVPGNEGRGYVLRRVIRRGLRYGRKLGLTDAFIGRVAERVIEHMRGAYPELERNRDFVLRTLAQEEERFNEALQNGLQFLKGFFSEIPEIERELKNVESHVRHKTPESASAIRRFFGAPTVARWGELTGVKGAGALMARERLIEGRLELAADDTLIDYEDIQQRLVATSDRLRRFRKTLPGDIAFFLYDTYGFPVELAEEIAREHGLDVDMEGFEREMEAQRERARAAARFGGDGVDTRVYEALGVPPTRFLGYETLEHDSVVLAILKDGQTVQRANAGEQVEVVLRETPFYAEGGGQVGDRGTMVGPSGRVEVTDTQSPVPELIVHACRVAEGAIAVGETVHAQVDQQHRAGAARNHTATHLLHAALRQVLGTHVRQAGSLVAPDRLRFDFTYLQAVRLEELGRIERLVNEKVRQDVPVQKWETTYHDAVAQGALAFFGDRYGDRVRVVQVNTTEPFSFEVCGGTHLRSTGEVGFVHIISESSIGSGMRRIEAVTGPSAEEWVRQRDRIVEAVAKHLQAPPSELERRASQVVQALEQERKRADALERELARLRAQDLLKQVQEVSGTKVLAARASVSSNEALREMGDWLRDKLGSAVVVLGAVVNDRPTLLCMVTPDLVKQGLKAGDIAREAAKVMGGGGGGRPEMAQAGGRRKEKLDDALRLVPSLVAQGVGS